MHMIRYNDILQQQLFYQYPWSFSTFLSFILIFHKVVQTHLFLNQYLFGTWVRRQFLHMVYDHFQTHNILTLSAFDSNISLQDSNSLMVPTQPVEGISMNRSRILPAIPAFEKE